MISSPGWDLWESLINKRYITVTSTKWLFTSLNRSYTSTNWQCIEGEFIGHILPDWNLWQPTYIPYVSYIAHILWGTNVYCQKKNKLILLFLYVQKVVSQLKTKNLLQQKLVQPLCINQNFVAFKFNLNTTMDFIT